MKNDYRKKKFLAVHRASDKMAAKLIIEINLNFAVAQNFQVHF